MVIPDLFGAYIKGREYAIDRNWQDLKNFEYIENARNQNDLNAMDIWERRQQMPGKMSMFYNQAKSSDLAMEVMNAAQRGRLAQANLGSDVAVGNYGVFKQNEQDYFNAVNGNFQERIRQQGLNTQNLMGSNDYLTENNRAYTAGQMSADTGYNTIHANNVTSGYYPQQAEQKATLNNLDYLLSSGTYNRAIDEQGRAVQLDPLRHQLEQAQLNGQIQNATNQPQISSENLEFAKRQEINAVVDEIYTLIRMGDDTSLAKAEYLAEQYGIDMSQLAVRGQSSTPAPAKPVNAKQVLNAMPIVSTVMSASSNAKPLMPTQAPVTNPQPTAQQVRAIMPTTGNGTFANLHNAVGVSYLPAYQVVE